MNGSTRKLLILSTVFIWACTFTIGCSKAGTGIKENSNRVEKGDLVSVNYIATLENGELIRTTLTEAANDETRERAAGYTRPQEFAPEAFLAGGDASLPGMGATVIGMALGEKKQVAIPPSRAFGSKDTSKIERMERIRRMPRLASFRPNQWMQKFDRFPQVGEEVQVSPYFMSRVTKVEENFVEVEALVHEKKTVDSPLGPVEIEIKDNEIIATLQPDIGVQYPRGDQVGRVVSVDDTTFSVDFNPPLSGKTIIVNLKIVDLIKAAEFEEDISWMEDYDEGLKKASETNKPMVLVLYAGWCGWSKRFLNNSMTDPRVKLFKDRFIWVKIDSDKNREYKEIYHQNGFPLIMMLDTKGEVIQRIDGFLNGGALSRELEKTKNAVLESVQANITKQKAEAQTRRQ